MKRMKIFITLFVSANLWAQDTSWRVISNTAFTFGERLTFELSYGFLTAADAFMVIAPSPMNIRGQDTYETSLEVNTRSSFDIIFKVRDLYKSFIHVKGIYPLRFEQHINETNYKKDFEIDFYHDSLKAYTKTDYINERVFDIPKYVQDLLSSFYYVRTMELGNKREGDVLTVQYFANDKVVNLNVRFEGKEEIDVPAGKFRTFVVKPGLTEGFTTKTSDLFIWISDDDRKIPVKVKLKIVIGSLVAELVSYSGINGPLNSKIE